MCGDNDLVAAAAEGDAHVIPKFGLCPEHVDVVDASIECRVNDACYFFF